LDETPNRILVKVKVKVDLYSALSWSHF